MAQGYFISFRFRFSNFSLEICCRWFKIIFHWNLKIHLSFNRFFKWIDWASKKATKKQKKNEWTKQIHKRDKEREKKLLFKLNNLFTLRDCCGVHKYIVITWLIRLHFYWSKQTTNMNKCSLSLNVILSAFVFHCCFFFLFLFFFYFVVADDDFHLLFML